MADPEPNHAQTTTLPTTDIETTLSSPDQLIDLKAKATAEYAVKHYKEAAELYSQATELQAEINGEMSIENADLLYAYGKCLYFLAQQTSSVLGGDAAAAQLKSTKEKKPAKKRKLNNTTNGEATATTIKAVKEDGEEAPALVDIARVEDVHPSKSTSDKPLFQISGDGEGWSDSDEEDDDDEEADDGDGEEQDDFTDAYEMLDIARVLYLRKLDHSEQSHLEESDKGKYIASIDQTPDVKETKRRIADIHDLQSEISLEGEKYTAAVEDLRQCLALKEELEPPESSLLAECHFKLSLALEFASQSQQRDSNGNPVGEMQIDWKIRDEAVIQQEKAIESCKLRVSKETKQLEVLEKGPEKDKALAQVEDVQEMIAEMEQRLAELRKPPVNVKEETAMKEQVAGVLESILGASEQEQQAKLAEVTASAADISGLVKRKKPKKVDSIDSGVGSAASTPAASAEPVKVNGKRKVEFTDDADGSQEGGKRAKVEDTEDSGL